MSTRPLPAYNTIMLPKDPQLNLFMGIGLWSLKDGLSEGLPVDVMHMLLPAAIVRSQIMEANRGKPSKILLLIADSMAVREGADKEKVSRLVEVYKKGLEPLLDLLNLKESTDITLSSVIESSRHYQDILTSLENSPILARLKIEDAPHYAYVLVQTAMTRYMNTHGQAGVKVGWICAESSRQLKGRASAGSLKRWDELKFDRWHDEICRDSTLQYLYAKAGLKQPGTSKSINVTEGPPYTAYPKDRRYLVQPGRKRDLKTVCPLQKSVAAHWRDAAEVCSSLMQARLAKGSLLPKGCIRTSHSIATVYSMLNHWINPPLDDRPPYSPAHGDAYEPLTLSETPKQKTHQRCILL